MTRVSRAICTALTAMLTLLCAASVGAQSARPGAPAVKAAPAIAATIGIASGFAALDERVTCAGDRVETLFLTVRNEGESDLVVRSARLLAPADLLLCGDGPEGAPVPIARTIGAGRRAVIPLRVGTREAPRPGTVPLLVEIQLSATIDGSERADTFLASDRVELRVPGLSEALQLLGVPTLLLLPGVLVLGLFSLVHPGEERGRLAPNGAAFWAIAITLSIVLSWLYTRIMSAFGVTRDLAERFTVADVAYVWIGSILIGAAAGGLARKFAADEAAKAARARAKDIEERTLTREDDPLTLLTKLKRLGIPWTGDWYEVGAEQGFLFDRAGLAQRWLVPKVAPPGRRPPEVEKTVWNAARAKLIALMQETPSMERLIKGLESPELAPLRPFKWIGEERPAPLGQDDFPNPGGTEYLIDAQ